MSERNEVVNPDCVPFPFFMLRNDHLNNCGLSINVITWKVITVLSLQLYIYRILKQLTRRTGVQCQGLLQRTRTTMTLIYHILKVTLKNVTIVNVPIPYLILNVTIPYLIY